MQIKFITDFGGRETGERHFTAGQVVELDDDLGRRLIADKRAVAVDPEPQPAPPAPAKKGKK